MIVSVRLWLVVMALCVTAGCRDDAPGVASRFALTGRVAGRVASPPRVMVAHDAIDGFMPAMTMPFEIVGATPFMRDGDRVAATLVVTRERSWLEGVRVERTADGVDGGRDAVATGASLGSVLPAFALVDQEGAPVTLRRFRGHVLVTTFIYTRCPLPDFCPLMVSHLETVRRDAETAGWGERVRFLGITLDPAFDTPEVLRAYGGLVLRDANRFDRWTLATGTPRQIQDVAAFFGVDYRAESGVVTHTLMTSVVGADGRLVRVFPSNSWRPGELFDAVQREARRD